MEKMKGCTKCKIEKPISCFSKNSGTKDGLLYICKECDAKYHKDKRKHYSEMAVRYLKNHPEIRNKRIFKTFGLSPELYRDMLISQHGVCAACKKPCSRNTVLSVDHDHKTGKVRKLLCSKCNLILGLANDDHHTLVALVNYLYEFRDK
jgi:hypothetical protein